MKVICRNCGWEGILEGVDPEVLPDAKCPSCDVKALEQEKEEKSEVRIRYYRFGPSSKKGEDIWTFILRFGEGYGYSLQGDLLPESEAKKQAETLQKILAECKGKVPVLKD